MLPIFQKKTPKRCAAVIVAAGTASRMNGIDKVMAELDGKPVIWYAIRAFDLNPMIDEIVVVTRADLLSVVAKLCADHEFSKVRNVVLGGNCRARSVLNGIAQLTNVTHIAVHDAARPLVSQGVITQTVQKALDTGAAAPAIPVKDTVKLAENGIVTQTPPRDRLFAVQTPQVFDAAILRAALENAATKELPITDDCSAAEAIGMKISLTAGEERNFKITTQADLRLARLWMEE